MILLQEPVSFYTETEKLCDSYLLLSAYNLISIMVRLHALERTHVEMTQQTVQGSSNQQQNGFRKNFDNGVIQHVILFVRMVC